MFECDVDDKTRGVLPSLWLSCIDSHSNRIGLKKKANASMRNFFVWIKFYYHLLCLFRLFHLYTSSFVHFFFIFIFAVCFPFVLRSLNALNIGCFKHHRSWCYESYVHDVMYALCELLLLLLLLLLLRIIKFHTHNRYDVWMARSRRLCMLCVSQRECERDIYFFLSRSTELSYFSTSSPFLVLWAWRWWLLPLRLWNTCTPNLKCNKARKK